jgi:N-acetylglucosaminyldiphosphoundecaprenol N-acetyl-beta-D-mannosaminyltransferase
LGAVVNFHASTVKRAPAWLKHAGLEWLWRIKEEPYLWQRYLHDGCALLRLLFTHIIPLAAATLWTRFDSARDFRILRAPMGQFVKVMLVGAATARHITAAVASFRDLSHTNAHVLIDVSHTRAIDARFFGLLLMLRRQLTQRGAQLKFTGVSPRLEKMFRLNGVGYLLDGRA